MQVFQILIHFLIQYQQVTLVNVTVRPIREGFRLWGTGKLRVADAKVT